MFDPKILSQAEELLAICREKKIRVVTAESCTGGMIGAYLTAIAGSSDMFERGFVTYTNVAKAEVLGVDQALLDKKGAVCEQVSREMATGALEKSEGNISVAVTGIAGPTGGSTFKPVGLVHMASASKNGTVIHTKVVFEGDRGAVRAQTVKTAMQMLLDQAKAES
jgi:nicotinamide-nucleotide amidase